MNNLITSGLNCALMAAESNAKVATKPMNMVSRELKKQNPDMELVERAGKYGMQELSKANEEMEKAREELQKAQKIEKQEKKIEQEEKLNEKSSEKVEGKENSTEETETSLNNLENCVEEESSPSRFDKLEISAEKLSDNQLNLELNERILRVSSPHRSIQNDNKMDVRV